MRNGTSTPVEVRTRAFSDSHELDRLLRIQIKVGSRNVFEGPLRRLRRWTVRRFNLAPGAQRRIRVLVWLPSSLPDAREARAANITFEWKSRATGEI